MAGWKEYLSTSKSKTLVVLDNGHDSTQAYNSSPEFYPYSGYLKDRSVGKLKEWVASRAIVKAIIANRPTSISFINLFPEDTVGKGQINLRLSRLNEIYAKYGKDYYIYCVSIHLDAASNKGWSNARGVSVHSNIHSGEARKIAGVLGEKLKTFFKLKGVFSGKGKRNDAALLDNKLKVPTVLVENGFMTNRDDVSLYLNDNYAKVRFSDLDKAKGVSGLGNKLNALLQKEPPFCYHCINLDTLAGKYIAAFEELEGASGSLYQERMKEKDFQNDPFFSDDVDIPKAPKGNQDTTPEFLDTSKFSVRVTKEVLKAEGEEKGDGVRTSPETILKHYYDFSENVEEDGSKSESDLNLDAEVEQFVADNFYTLFNDLSSDERKSFGYKLEKIETKTTKVVEDGSTSSKVKSYRSKGENINKGAALAKALEGKVVKGKHKGKPFSFTISKMLAAAIAGSCLVEDTTLDPWVVNKSSGATGICQWLGVRKGANWFKFAGARGYNKSIGNATFQQQIDYIIYELNTTETRAAHILSQCKTLEDATRKVRDYYERGGINSPQAKYAETLSNAQRILGVIPESVPSYKTVVVSSYTEVAPDINYAIAKEKYPQLIENFKRSVPINCTYVLNPDKLKSSLFVPSANFASNIDLPYVNPFMLKTIKRFDAHVEYINSARKLYPKALAWVYPQSRAVEKQRRINLTKDIISLSFNRSLRGESQFQISLTPVKAKFVFNSGERETADDGIWVPSNATSKSQESVSSPKEFSENDDFFYAKVLNPGDVVYIVLEDKYRPEKSVYSTDPSVVSPENETDDNIAFVGIIDKISKSTQITNTTQDSISIEGRSFMKIFEDDTVFFETTTTTRSRNGLLSDKIHSTVASDVKKTSDSINKATAQTFDIDRVASTWLDLYRLISAESVPVTLNRLLSKLKVLPQEFEAPDGSLVKITDLVCHNFDQNLINRAFYTSKLATMEGSLLQFLSQFAPQPFIEMWWDTYPKITSEELEEFKKEYPEWIPYDDVKMIGKEDETTKKALYKWNSDQIFHIVVRNAPLTLEKFMALPAFFISKDLITSIQTEVTDAQMFSTFQVLPKSLFIGDKQSDVMAFPAMLFSYVAKHYGFRLSKVESSYFAQKQGDSKYGNGNLFEYTQRDIIVYSSYMLGNAFYETGKITTVPLQEVRPGMALCIPTTGGIYRAYITDVRQVRDASPKNCKTEITFERGLLDEGHRLIAQLSDVKFLKNEGEEVTISPDGAQGSKGNHA
mgnify:CR=1 FL=1